MYIHAYHGSHIEAVSFELTWRLGGRPNSYLVLNELVARIGPIDYPLLELYIYIFPNNRSTLSETCVSVYNRALYDRL